MKQNFKTLACIFAAATIALFAASCKKEMFKGNPKTMPMVGVKRAISAAAAMPQGSDKAFLDDTDGRKVKWELTDALNINGTNLPLASLNADATSARFEGTTYAIPSGSNHIYWAVYPTTLSNASSGSSIHSDYTASTLTVNFPTTQTYNSSASALSGNTYMAGYASVPSGNDKIVFQMRNLGAVLKLHLTADASATNKRASRIEFSTTNGALAGEFEVDNTSDPAVTATVNSTQTLTVNLTDGTNNYIDITSGADIYVILPPMASKNLTMGIYNTDGGMSSKTVSSTTLARKNIYTNTVSDLCFCDNSFSVSATQQVVFAPGNLQWSASGTRNTVEATDVAGTFRFAEHQWDFVGDASSGNVSANGTKCDNASISQSYTGWIDLFGWGTSGWNNGNYFYHPYDNSNSTSSPYTSSNGYGYGPTDGGSYSYSLTGAYANADWGVYNAIYNPKTNTTDPAGTWRTPTKDEWVYVLNTRTTSSGVRYAKATVADVPGLIIVPDNWSTSTYTLNSTNTTSAAYNTNEITSLQWSTLENAGCAFLPAAGRRNGTSVSSLGSNSHGNYCSSTYRAYSGSLYAYYLHIYSVGVNPGDGCYRYFGLSVRLVKNI